MKSICLVGILFGHSILVQDLPIEVSEIVERWEAWANSLDMRGGIETTTTWVNNPSRAPWVQSIKVDGKFRIKSSQADLGGQPYSSISISNGSYFAQIKKSESGYLLEKVEARSEESPLARNFLVSTYLGAMREPNFEWMSERSPDLVEKLESSVPGEQRWKIVFVDPSDRVQRYEVTVTDRYDWLPESISLFYTSAPKFPIVEEHYDYVRKGDEIQFVGMEVVTFSKDRRSSEIHRIIENDYQNISKIPTREQCFLTYYDLPEPKFSSNQTKWIYWLGSIFFLLCAGASWLYLKRRK